MEWLDALSAEDSQVVGAVEVLDALLMLLTHFVRETLFIFLVKVETYLRQDGILCHDLVQNVNVKR